MIMAVATGLLAKRGCIQILLAHYIIFGLTLTAALLYAWFTYGILEVNKDTFRLAFQDPTIITWIEPKLLAYRRPDGKDDLNTAFFITNQSRVHAVAKVDLNPELDGKTVTTDDAYSGKKWWYVPAGKQIQGLFSLLSILESA
ncbi:hypothetical protein MUP77_09040, partial [Candidatus Bathyarchaeota archaeon]|nr:hypothetical protein [Candidatus Bathyarchaeota archaeon]